MLSTIVVLFAERNRYRWRHPTDSRPDCSECPHFRGDRTRRFFPAKTIRATTIIRGIVTIPTAEDGIRDKLRTFALIS